jgi:hypothetical protein
MTRSRAVRPAGTPHANCRCASSATPKGALARLWLAIPRIMPAGTGSSTHLRDPGRTRDKVGRGRAGDKSPAFDLAAAPIHTDAEADGSGPVHAASMAATRAQQPRPVSEEVGATHTNPGRGQTQIPERRMAWLIALGFALLILLGLAVAVVTLP